MDNPSTVYQKIGKTCRDHIKKEPLKKNRQLSWWNEVDMFQRSEAPSKCLPTEMLLLNRHVLNVLRLILKLLCLIQNGRDAIDLIGEFISTVVSNHGFALYKPEGTQ